MGDFSAQLSLKDTVLLDVVLGLIVGRTANMTSRKAMSNEPMPPDAHLPTTALETEF
jgi:hypothetical protein